MAFEFTPMPHEERLAVATEAIRNYFAERGMQVPAAASTRDGNQRRRTALRDAVVLDLLGHGGEKYHAPASQDYRDFSGMTLLQKARTSLLVDGYDADAVNRANDQDVAMASLGFVRHTSFRNDAASTVPASLPEVLRDAINKSLQAAYLEAPTTYQAIFEVGTVNDFKTSHVIRLGMAPNLPVWHDNSPAEEAALGNERVPLEIEARSAKISFSWRTLINDDMDALSRTPRLLGDAAARTVNSAVWSIITGNPVMNYDSVSLFSAATGSRYDTNLITGSASPTTSTIGAMTKLMRLMRGPNTPGGGQSAAVLSIQPRFLIVPATLETVATQLTKSVSEPASGYSVGVFNPNSNLVPVVEGLLDASSVTAFYIAADPKRCPVGRVNFLRGQETPVVRDFVDEESLSHSYAVLQSFGCAAIDHRCIVKHAGA